LIIHWSQREQGPPAGTTGKSFWKGPPAGITDKSLRQTKLALGLVALGKVTFGITETRITGVGTRGAGTSEFRDD
jgi:hypothetical protein